MSWPFEAANSLGFAMFENFTSAQATIIDQNAAAAASGEIWSDLALVRTVLPEETINAGSAVVSQSLLWEPTTGRWFNFGATATSVATAFASHDGGNWATTSMTSDVTDTDWNSAERAATDGAGIVVVAGSTSAAYRIRRSDDAGATWERRAVTNATGACRFAVWIPSAAMFLIGFVNTSNINIETSSDGITWNVATAPNTNARSAAAVSPTICVVLSNTNTDKCITSDDGVAWTERTLPSSAVRKAIAYSSELNTFLAIADDGSMVKSTDGITWTAAGLTAPPHISSEYHLRSVGRMWLFASGNYYQASLDGGATWQILSNFTMNSGFQFGAGPQQILFGDGADTRRSLIGGV